MAIYYLDVDDEITSAAARIRDSSDTRIALVLSGGSRVATSRINFRLLAREARQRNKRLAIVTADATAQSVARSAELPVYSTVNEYERSEAAAARGAHGMPPVETSVALDELAMTVGAGGTAARPTGPGASRFPGGAPAGNSSIGRPRISRSLLAGAALLVLALVAATAFFFYPSATIVVTLREETLGPMTVSVGIDPAIAAANDQALRVPGSTMSFPVTASDTFDATGQKVVDTAATGKVTFTSVNTVQPVVVAAGTQVSTASGVRFRTTVAVTVPRATVAVPIITPGSADVSIAALLSGPAGNVAANTIVRVPASLSSNQVSVSNPNPTSGGAHSVTPEVAQADLDRAEKTLLTALDANFQAAVNGAGATPSGSSLFPESAQLGTPSCSPDPAGLLGQDVATFQLSCQATGTATVADIAGVVAMADRRARAAVRTGYSLVEDSVATTVGATITQGSTLTVPVTVEAYQVRNIDADQLRAGVVGKSVSEARQFLSQFGDVDLTVSPDWASTMPSFDFRIDVRVVSPPGLPSLRPSPSVVPTAGPRTTAVPRTTAGNSPAISPSPSEGASQSPSDTPTVSPTTSPTPFGNPSASPTAAPSASPTSS